MDGNNRWSKKNNLDINTSYKQGAENLIKIANHCFFKQDINYVSAFALSSHNLSRSKKLISVIFKILNSYLNDFLLNNEQYKFNIRFIGNLDIFEKKIKDKLISVNNKNAYSKTLIIALNYSGTDDISNASSLFNKNTNKKLKFNDFLYTANYPNPDVLIRTGGYQRLSDFFLFQINFTELFFSKLLWPDFKIKPLDTIINKFIKIERKFGK
jgi:undecaprenyl diphosphate synthase